MNILSTGKWHRRTKNRICITELPIGIWTQTYKDWLEKPSQQSWIKRVEKDESTPDKVYFEISVDINDEKVVEKFKLSRN